MQIAELIAAYFFVQGVELVNINSLKKREKPNQLTGSCSGRGKSPTRQIFNKLKEVVICFEVPGEAGHLFVQETATNHDCIACDAARGFRLAP
ncbi:hypothetical protein [Pseudovibrio sp. SPO723]|uniref:hypothetical protein n=1 Tax=Nesiotobacter zosterae TaxID=392721 RepID=UPI0029C5C48D|nr:hypothetical protein [Pseudovibrio sp. SPO723]MDX5593044.1 hypothetical protein [Pseudovibrio sp. SPO723]